MHAGYIRYCHNGYRIAIPVVAETITEIDGDTLLITPREGMILLPV